MQALLESAPSAEPFARCMGALELGPPYISLHLPTSPCISLHLPASPRWTAELTRLRREYPQYKMGIVHVTATWDPIAPHISPFLAISPQISQYKMGIVHVTPTWDHSYPHPYL